MNRPAYMDNPLLYTAYVAENAEVLAHILRVFVPAPALIADVTFNAGSFWRGEGAAEVLLTRLIPPAGWNLSQLTPEGLTEWRKIEERWPTNLWSLDWRTRPKEGYMVVASDLLVGHDCRQLPYKDGELDAVVFDPPYAGTGGTGKNPCKDCSGSGTVLHPDGVLNGCDRCDGTGKTKASGSGTVQRFGNSVLGSRGTVQILELYQQGIAEARRVLRTDGVCIVKVQDQIESGRQVYLTDAVKQSPGWECVQDVAVVSPTPPRMRHTHQHHARRNHSLFVVLRKLRERRVRSVERQRMELPHIPMWSEEVAS